MHFFVTHVVVPYIAPPLGTSLRLGVPSLRHCSVGPPRRAIHGPARLSRHPCRDAHCAMPAFGQRGLTGRPDQKQSKSGAHAGIYVAEPPPSRASSLPHWISGEHKFMSDTEPLWERACSRRGRHIQHLHWLTLRFREQARSHRRNAVSPRTRPAIRPPRGGR